MYKILRQWSRAAGKSASYLPSKTVLIKCGSKCIIEQVWIPFNPVAVSYLLHEFLRPNFLFWKPWIHCTIHFKASAQISHVAKMIQIKTQTGKKPSTSINSHLKINVNFLAIIWLNMSKLDHFLFSYRKPQTHLCKLFLHVSQQNSINVCASTKERSLFAVLVLRSTWFRYILSEAVQSKPFHQITCTLSWFPGALYCTCVLSVADIVFCLLQTECLALSAFSFFLSPFF